MNLQKLIDGLKAHKSGAASYESVDEAIREFEAMRDVDGAKVYKRLEELRNFADTGVHPIVSPENWGVYSDLCDLIDEFGTDALALIRQQQERIKAQDEVIRALRNVGYPHNFQREPTWIVNYMYAITDVIKKAVKLE